MDLNGMYSKNQGSYDRQLCCLCKVLKEPVSGLDLAIMMVASLAYKNDVVWQVRAPWRLAYRLCCKLSLTVSMSPSSLSTVSSSFCLRLLAEAILIWHCYARTPYLGVVIRFLSDPPRPGRPS